MNNHKVCFIYCVNDEALFAESVRYVHALEIPEGFQIEVLPVSGASSITAGYNFAMSSSDAKYKVYLHQDVFITNRQFISDIVTLFASNSKLGMIGVAGAADIPVSGIWWNAAEKYGKLFESHTGKMELLSFREVTGDYKPVQAIDGLLMVTQYDVPWREDLFKGWHLYDSSQTQEFIRAGYEVGVPHQEKPWCIHDCGIVNVRNGYEANRDIFLEEYSRDLFPLVSILIPTYNRPHYFELALRSALEQTYKNIEIVICDDSTNNDTDELIQKYLDSGERRIRYFKNERNLGQFENDLQCMELARGDYVNFLMDDDLFHPRKIEKMMHHLLNDTSEEIALVTSHRQLIDEEGRNLPDWSVTKRLFEQDTLIDGLEFGNFMLKQTSNYIGEPTTVLFRKNLLEEQFGTFGGRQYICNVDMASWLNLLSKGKIVYISETLSYFRIHGDQQLKGQKMLLMGTIDLAHSIMKAPLYGFFADTSVYLQALENGLRYLNSVDSQLLATDKQHPDYPQLQMYRELMQHKEAACRAEAVDAMPLVSILIPAYNRPRLLELALQSALRQTYPNIEIVICDDSTNDEVRQMLAPYLQQHAHIRYYRNEKTFGPYNKLRCLEVARGEYINFLNDDDLFHIDKIQRMLRYFLANEDVTLVTSYRQMIGEDGAVLPDTPTTARLFNEDTVLSGHILMDHALKQNMNVIGEPTTVLFRKSDLTESFGHLAGEAYPGLMDMATWVHLLSKGKAVYISDALSYYRQHGGQMQKDNKFMFPQLHRWGRLIQQSHTYGFLRNNNDYKIALLTFIYHAARNVQMAYESNQTEHMNRAELGQILASSLEQSLRE